METHKLTLTFGIGTLQIAPVHVRIEQHKPVIAVVGLLDADMEAVAAAGITAVYETNDRHLPFEAIKDSARADLIRAAKRIEI